MNTNNVYQMVTDRIIEQMSKGQIPWQKPWHFNTLSNGDDCAVSYTTRRAYSVLNQWLLGEPGEYLTFKQIKERGGMVKKGEKSKFVVFYTQAHYKERDPETGEEKLKPYPLLKYYNVWHIKQTEGIESKVKTREQDVKTLDPINEAENAILGYLMRETSLKFYNDKPSSKAYYSPSEDKVVVPMLGQYDIAAEYYSTTFHELVHSTLKESRCNREGENARAFFGNHEYSREELVAEMGAAMLCSNCGIENPKTFRNSVAYLQAWMASLKNDPKMIVWAASRAEKATRYILGEKPAETK